MNAKSVFSTLIAIAALSTAGAALATEATLDSPASTVSTLTRDDVRNAAIEARIAGLLHRGEATVHHEAALSLKTRAQVVAEAVEARRLGVIAGGEATVLPTPAQLERIQMAGLNAVPMNLAQR
jgi:Domain of unknown function (DUF4148)